MDVDFINKTEECCFVVTIMTDFLTMIENQFNKKVLCVGTYNAKELYEETMLLLSNQKGILLQKCCPDTP